MKACLLRTPGRIENNPLEFAEAPQPAPGNGQVLVRIHVCGVAVRTSM